MAKITQIIEMACVVWNGGGANTYVSEPGIQTKLNTADFDGTVTYYFEANIKNGGTAGQTTFAQLYDLTDSAVVSGSEVSTTSVIAIRMRSGPIILSGDKKYCIQLKHSNTENSAHVLGARIIVVQEGTITKTQVQIDFVAEHGATSTSSTNRPDCPLIFIYDASDFDGTVSIRHDAILRAEAGQISYSGIYNATDGTIVDDSTISTVSTDWDTVSSAPISLVDGKKYEVTSYVDGGAGTIFENNKLVFTITGTPTKFKEMIRISYGTLKISKTNSFWYYSVNNHLLSNNDFDGATTEYYYSAIMRSSNASGIASSILVNVNENAGWSSTVHMHGASITMVTSNVLSLASESIEYAAGLNSDATTYGAVLYQAYVEIYVTNLINRIGPFPVFFP